MIDIIFIALLALAVFKGFTRGAIVAIFSVIAFVIGIAAAMKLSTIAAARLQDSVHVNAKWLPFIAFALVFVATVFLVRMGASLIQKTIEFALLGWLNKLLGVVVYVVLYTIIYSVVLFYANKMNLISKQAIDSAVSYPFIAPWGPKAIELLSIVIPWFKDMFGDLSAFFEKTAENIPAK